MSHCIEYWSPMRHADRPMSLQGDMYDVGCRKLSNQNYIWKLKIQSFAKIFSIKYVVICDKFWVHKNCIKIGDLSPLDTYRRTKCTWPETFQRPIKDHHSWLETFSIPKCLWRPIGDRHACKVQCEFKHIYSNILIFILYSCWKTVIYRP